MESETRVAEDVERWMVDYEHGDGEPQHAVLSWLNDEAKALPEVGTYLVRLDALETAQAEKAAAVVVADQRGWQIARMAGEAREKDETIARLRKALELSPNIPRVGEWVALRSTGKVLGTVVSTGQYGVVVDHASSPAVLKYDWTELRPCPPPNRASYEYRPSETGGES